MRTLRFRRAERGFSSMAAIVAVLICAAVASATVFANAGSSKQAQGALARERAFQAAEAGIDLGIARLRTRLGAIPNPPRESGVFAGSGTFDVKWIPGNADGIDDDGDGTVDEADESLYVMITATGTSGRMRRTTQVVMEKETITPYFPAATHIADPTPAVDLSGAAFRISGAEHFLDGTLDPSRTPKYGISSEADPSVLDPQILAPNRDQITGAGGIPSIGQDTTFDLDALIALVDPAATLLLAPGTHRNGDFGTATPAGIAVIRCDGDLHFTGNNSGAGVLVVHGDLTITGDFKWTGIILVEGLVRLNGGGSTIRLVGALAVGDEITDSLDVSGTVDLYYSSDAVQLASTALVVPVVRAWRETANP